MQIISLLSFQIFRIEVYHFRVLCDDCGDDVSAWISNVLGKQCRLVRQRQGDIRMMKTKKNPDCQNGNYYMLYCNGTDSSIAIVVVTCDRLMLSYIC